MKLKITLMGCQVKPILTMDTRSVCCYSHLTQKETCLGGSETSLKLHSQFILLVRVGSGVSNWYLQDLSILKGSGTFPFPIKDTD